MRIGLPAAVLAAVFVHGCVAPRDRAPAPEPAPVRPVASPQPSPAPTPAPTPVTPLAAWADLPDTPGAWAYQADTNSSAADFADGGARMFRLSCTPSTRRVRFERQGAAGGGAGMAVQTSYGVQRLPALPATPDATVMAAELPATSPLLDQMAFSRGHFTVDVAGMPRLVVPAQPELARVVEDCRG